jgi:site-specific recombinase XerD
MVIFHSRDSVRHAAAVGAPSASTLRVKDVAFSANQLVVRDDKGHKDSVTLLPAAAKASPGRKYPNAGREWAWQTVFPATRTYVDQLTGQRRRYLHDIRTVQERLGRRDVSTTMIYTHVLNRGPAGVTSPAHRVLDPDPGPTGLGPKGDAR